MWLRVRWLLHQHRHPHQRLHRHQHPNQPVTRNCSRTSLLDHDCVIVAVSAVPPASSPADSGARNATPAVPQRYQRSTRGGYDEYTYCSYCLSAATARLPVIESRSSGWAPCFLGSSTTCTAACTVCKWVRASGRRPPCWPTQVVGCSQSTLCGHSTPSVEHLHPWHTSFEGTWEQHRSRQICQLTTGKEDVLPSGPEAQAAWQIATGD